MRLLDLFSGTGSVSGVANSIGFEVTTLDLANADINTDILEWDYEEYSPHYFDVIWASPPCDTFSKARFSLIGRYGYTRESLDRDVLNKGVPLLRKTEQILDYFQPKVWFIENPQTGRMKDYVSDKPFYDVDYCRYGFNYKKRTRIWTNLEGFEPKLCNKQCGSFENGRHLMKAIGASKTQPGQGGGRSRNSRYKIPVPLINELLMLCYTSNDESASESIGESEGHGTGQVYRQV